MTISPPVLEDRDDWARVAFEIDGLGPSQLWFDVSAEGAAFIHRSCDAALVSLVLSAMIARKPIRVEGKVSSRLLWNLRNIVLPVVTRQLPWLEPIEIEASETTEDGSGRGTATMTGWSRGVDSFSAIQDHYLDSELADADRVTHLLFSHIGHHGSYGELDERVHERWLGSRAAAERLGLPIVRVYSNGPDFYPLEHDHVLNWQATLSVRNASAPLLLQGGVRRFLVASSNKWEDIFVGPTFDMTKADPVIVPALSTERMELAVVGSEYARAIKTRRIASLEVVQQTLDVCIIEGTNCSRCEKCLRTMLMLEILGRLDDFAGCFDLELYRKQRTGFIARVLTERKRVYHREMKALMSEPAFHIPWSARLQVALLFVWRLIPHRLRRRLRGLGSADRPGADRYPLDRLSTSRN